MAAGDHPSHVVGTEEHVDLDEDNYIEEEEEEEEMSDEPSEEDDRMDERKTRDEDYNEHGKEEEEGDEEEEEDNLKSDDDQHANGKAALSEDDGGAHNGVESIEEDEDKANLSKFHDDEMKKRAELLALPPHGSEVFIGGLPRDVTEDDLRNLCERIGEVTEVRLMKDKDTGENKGYAFITYKTKEFGQDAIEEFRNKEFKGRTIRCSLSQAKHRLFMGNIPKSWSEQELRRAIEENGPGVENIELLKDPQNPSRNRGFAFVEFYNNACADYARQNMSTPKFKLDGNTPTVSWADPKSSPDPAAAAQVKALYVKNLPENTTTEQLKELFRRHGEVTKIVLPPGKGGQNKKEFGFIHYAERSSALKAIKGTEKYEIDGRVLDVALAKPLNEKKFDTNNSYKPAAAPAYLPYQYGDPYGAAAAAAAYGGAAAAYGGTAAAYGGGAAAYGGVAAGGGFQQPMIYGRGPMPAGMAMVPMVLPDGRVGYVLQQPGAQTPAPQPSRRDDRGSGSGRSQGRGGNGGGDGGRNRRYHPY
ncbi:heterogeneous nuclear ribonucleoprotein Q-like [Papaver somniferum]|uniref:heterogeneous nuclear ribonucleoprotein Q-like n=1 Tax=Papaver somniferum TaxID=3469 RepID=UPI000E6FB9E4|nr:heterogeneous nuclear ribonucleoprotein Q-like [Papaver somniferum]XP_026441085.1 heterogeneous nuclear ribonucleoprotein Q-like [Papaver somniferum]XP_026441086.1 heterogeneous nuclear ribonucleoprotein Q-like [Papaver somniferum]XP_026441088.1 heterogeneous nuclear ribonucleoprotein Q-like [Papaver somniferum]